jgi:NADPH-dependent 2,4-dienoyl-CoA reductase/sulfur reductase-like enzyme
MKSVNYDAVVIGCGAAGMAAAVSLGEKKLKVAVLDRESLPGGILLQCIHNGFGLHRFKEELTGPEYAEKFINMLKNNSNIDLYLKTSAVKMKKKKRCTAIPEILV